MNEQLIRNLCEQSGLAVSEIRATGDVLAVTPASLDQLPDADTLAELAGTLREQTSYRYVTLAIAGADQ